MLMRTMTAIAVLTGLSAALVAQGKSDDELKQLRTEKLAKDVFKKNNWLTDYDKARSDAKAGNKPIFAYFTRSYARWGPCDALESGPLSDAGFPEFAKKVVLFLHNTAKFPGALDDEKYGELLSQKGFNAFPTVCWMDAEGNVLMKQGDRSVAGFEKTLGEATEKMNRRKELTAKAKSGDVAAQKELFLADMQAGQLTAQQVKEGAKKLTLSKEEQAQVDQTLTDFDVREIQKGARSDPGKAAEQVAALAKQGRLPGKAMAQTFWSMTLTHAATTKDAKLAEQAFGELEKLAAADKRLERGLERWKKQLEEAKAQEQGK